jgi:hypothetical protein
MRSAHDLLMSARRSLTEASIATTAGERYAAAHLAALRAAAAVIATASRPAKRARVRSAWTVLPQAAPEFAEWAAFFAAGAAKRAGAEAGLPCVTQRAADDLAREADVFVARVTEYLGLPHQSSLTSVLLHVG